MLFLFVFFFNDTATTEIYTLSLHDALPIFDERLGRQPVEVLVVDHRDVAGEQAGDEDLRAATQPGRTPHPFARRSGDRQRHRTRSSAALARRALACWRGPAPPGSARRHPRPPLPPPAPPRPHAPRPRRPPPP